MSKSDSGNLSRYQEASRSYYKEMRGLHSGIYGSQDRMEEELKKKRYHHIDQPELESEIQNLGSFIKILFSIHGRSPGVKGVDFGCGSHWFVDHLCHLSSGPWKVEGYDSDPFAIYQAWMMFARSKDHYHERDPLRKGLPEEDGSQDFVFSNAVFQHFDDAETTIALAEISRVLRPGGTFLLIFKHWIDDLTTSDSKMVKPPQILNQDQGMVKYFDPTMSELVKKMPKGLQKYLEEDAREGWRLYHIISIERMLELAKPYNLTIRENVPFGEKTARGVVTYRSGKSIPTAALVFEKN